MIIIIIIVIIIIVITTTTTTISRAPLNFQRIIADPLDQLKRNAPPPWDKAFIILADLFRLQDAQNLVTRHITHITCLFANTMTRIALCFSLSSSAQKCKCREQSKLIPSNINPDDPEHVITRLTIIETKKSRTTNFKMIKIYLSSPSSPFIRPS